MITTKNSRKTGAINVSLSYVCWGLLTVFWNLLADVNSVYVLAQRVIWSMIFMAVFLVVIHQTGELRKVFSSPKMIASLFVCGVLICINWGVYIYAINSGHVLDASLGYFLEPIIVTMIGLLLFREKMNRMEKITAMFSIIGVGYLVYSYHMIPIMAIVIGLSFAFYGAAKKNLDLRPEVSLFGETLMVTPIALIFCIYSEIKGVGSLQVFHGAQFLLFPLAGVVTSIPLLLFNRGVKEIPYYLAGILMYINPTLQFLMGLFYFHETLEIPRLIAFGFIWVGMGFTIWYNLQALRRN